MVIIWNSDFPNSWNKTSIVSNLKKETYLIVTIIVVYLLLIMLLSYYLKF